VTLLILIAAAAFLARGSRQRLLWLFGIGRRLVLAVLSLLVLSQGLIAFVTIAALSSVMFHSAPGFLLFPVALGTFIGSFIIIKSSFGLVRLPPLQELGMAVGRNEQPHLWAMVSSIAAQLNTSPPDNIVLSMKPGFYATTFEVATQNQFGSVKGETLCLSLPLMRLMDLTEMAAIIGHELGHFRGRDVVFSRKFAPIYAHMNRVCRFASSATGAAQLPFLPVHAILSFFLQQFSYAERAISRQRENEADAAGVSVAGADALATSLIKCAVLSPLLQRVQNEALALLRQGRMFTNLNVRFEELAGSLLAVTPRSEIAKAAAMHAVTHPTDTHPPIAIRLRAIGVSVDDAAVQVVPPKQAAASIIDALEGIERRLTAIHVQLLKRLAGGAQPAASPALTDPGRAAAA
jgi:Zn-dependent protease with chaperone function